jgi:ABC-type transport system involved in cytochrome c biogenesis permease component
MNGLLQHLGVSLRLHFRNRLALIYGYLFPLIFLVAFYVLYRHEKIPLLRHMGELLTVAVLGGACFGLPTTLVSERERGVWRRYRLTPIPTWAIVTSTVVARYVIVLTAGLLQIVAALVLGMTMPAHAFDLWVAFTFVSFAFIGLGLVIATLADNVPAVQALGQCIFLPMLIIGGVAVQLASLPEWAQHVSAFFPGRYAVEALQACVTGRGIPGARFSLLALALIGFAGCLAGAKLFRWDAQQRFASRAGKFWLAPVFLAWIAVGLLAEWRGRIGIPVDKDVAPPAATSPGMQPSTQPTPSPVAPTTQTPSPVAVTPPPTTSVPAPTTAPASGSNRQTTTQPASSNVNPPANVAAVPPQRDLAMPPPVREPVWAKITQKDIDGLDYAVPPDQGIVSPFAPPDEGPEDFMKEQVDTVRNRIASWPPGNEGDELRCIRNLLYIAAVPDAIQLPVERYLPRVVYEHLVDSYPKDKLVKVLTYIALHPEEGMVIDDVSDLGIEGTAGDPTIVRERAYLYAIKMIARLTGRVRE